MRKIPPPPTSSPLAPSSFVLTVNDQGNFQSLGVVRFPDLDDFIIKADKRPPEMGEVDLIQIKDERVHLNPSAVLRIINLIAG